ncbi:hypothetical protein CC78DRAFT_575024 [Lojkania enalia]|uniref:Uncharacterized protein n=1 Tax=Lojkania enalia TaxID=147567 RepID=A0A9P4NA63_9PLEO|nr:hypothetical protein CC78DRAFT_575024 [Didymosphaeria enalia]
MLVRSPRKLVILSFTAFIFILIALTHPPWTASSVYERVSLFTTKNADFVLSKQSGVIEESFESESESEPGPPWKTGRKVRPNKTPWIPEDMKKYMKEMLNWNRPSWLGHWPPFADYQEKEYDPNRWEKFDLDYRIYDAGHDKLEKHVASFPHAYKPFADYNSAAWKKEWKGRYVPCMGPRGVRLNESSDDLVKVYHGLPEDSPPVFAGGYDVIGLDGDICFDRYSRYSPYGLGFDEFAEHVVDWKVPDTEPNWTYADWGRLQDECLEANKDRFHPKARDAIVKIPSTELPPAEVASSAFASPTGTSKSNMENRASRKPKYHHRTAVLIRAWTGYEFEENDLMAIRAMISELSLQSGGEYQVFLYVHVKDSRLPIFDDSELYAAILEESIPPELQDIAILWSESIFPKWYPEVMDWQVYWQQFMCLQWFSITHPEFDYVWNWETDARYIGHHYHFFEKIAEFADKQPRKLLWERNKRYYIPSIHGSYEAFVEDTHSNVLNASANSLIPPPIWGPRPWPSADPPQKPLGPSPPTSFDDDDFQWGINEPADFITLLPIWDPRNTSWSYKDKIWNYIPGIQPLFTPEDGQADWFTHPNFTQIERRVFINTVVRFSKKMLQAMHEENLVGRSMQAEMWPGTVALQHGLKAVYAPHPIFIDRLWPEAYTASIFDTANTVNEKGGAEESVQGAWTEQADSPYNHDREYNFMGWSWYFASRFPRSLYRRWLGWGVVMQDWEEAERTVGREEEGQRSEKRMCVRGMLLHPVKKMKEDLIRL